MKVLIDAHMVGSQETGNETYVTNLLIALEKLMGKEIGAIVDPTLTLSSEIENSSIEKLSLNGTGNWRRLVYAIPHICRNWQPDLLHVTYVAPLTQQCPLVVSVHDISFKRFPEYFSPRDRLLFATLLPLSLKRAAAVLTLSNHACDEILTYYPNLQGKVHVIYLAASDLFKPIDDISQAKEVLLKYGVGDKFVMAVGNLQPRKNLVRLVQAFAKVADTIKAYQLVFVGKEQWQSSQVYETVASLGLESRVVFAGYVPVSDLVLMYNAASLFIYPSMYEGFGLPILEAMSCGTPVVTSNISSMPEVAGGAAVLTNPYQVEAMAEAMVSVLSDQNMAEDLAQRGLKQAEQFSWEKTAEATAKVYRSVHLAREAQRVS